MVKLGTLSEEEVNLNGGSLHREENREFASERSGVRGAEDMCLRNDQVGIERHVEKNCTDHSSVSDHKWALDNDFDMSKGRDYLHKPTREREVREVKSHIRRWSESQRSTKVADWQTWERNEMNSFQRRHRNSIPMHRDEVPSNCHSRSCNGFRVIRGT